MYIFLRYLVQFFLELKNASDKDVQKIEIDILYLVVFFKKSCLLWDNVEKYRTAGQATDDNKAHAHCMLGPRAT